MKDINLLLLDGQAHPQNSANYRGTYRAHPMLPEDASIDSELGRLFMWFLEEGGERGVVHDVTRASRLIALLNNFRGGQKYELVRVASGHDCDDGQAIGYDLSSGFGYSLLSTGLRRPSESDSAPVSPAAEVLCPIVFDHFRPMLNDRGLFNLKEQAQNCLIAFRALQSLSDGLFENGDLSEFAVVALFRIDA